MEGQAQEHSGIDNTDEAGTLQDVLDRMRTQLEALSTARASSEAAVQGAEAARMKADSESGFAFNAKKNAEEHASFIAQTRGKVEADVAWLTSTKKEIQDAAQAISTTKTSVDADAKAATDCRAVAERDSAAVTASRTAAEAALAVAQKAQGDLSARLEDATTSGAAVTAAKASAEASLSAVQTAQAAVAESLARASSDTAAIEARGKESKAVLDSITDTATKVKDTRVRVDQYEGELERMQSSFAALQAKVEGLLPHAASASLASAFREQKQRFRNPLRSWVATFAGALLALFVTGFVGLDVSKDSWDAIIRHFVQRLPIVVPLVWLAIFSGRNFMLALRAQEEYAFKEAISTAFEGYKREMSSIQVPAGVRSPIVGLYEHVLRVLSLRPGRIYEAKPEDITPLSPLTKAIEPLAAAVAPGGKGVGEKGEE
jgi:hypothetical protein